VSVSHSAVLRAVQATAIGPAPDVAGSSAPGDVAHSDVTQAARAAAIHRRNQEAHRQDVPNPNTARAIPALTGTTCRAVILSRWGQIELTQPTGVAGQRRNPRAQLGEPSNFGAYLAQPAAKRRCLPVTAGQGARNHADVFPQVRAHFRWSNAGAPGRIPNLRHTV
jgi:hypothetical protein